MTFQSGIGPHPGERDLLPPAHVYELEPMDFGPFKAEGRSWGREKPQTFPQPSGSA